MLGMVKNLVDTSLDPSKLKIYFTGGPDSLGATHSCTHVDNCS